MAKKKSVKKQMTPEQKVNKRKAARARHWRKTGVSEATIQWMRDNDML